MNNFRCESVKRLGILNFIENFRRKRTIMIKPEVVPKRYIANSL